LTTLTLASTLIPFGSARLFQFGRKSLDGEIPPSGDCGDGVTYTLTRGVLTITGTGVINSTVLNNTGGILTIIIDEQVTGIAEYSLMTIPSLRMVRIGKSLTSIGITAFANCQNLISISVSEENPVLSSYQGMLFNKDQTQLKKCPSEKELPIVLPNTVKELCSLSFAGVPITSFEIPDSVEKLDETVFKECTYLVSVIIPASVKTIEKNLFYYCPSLTSITFLGTECTAEETIIVSWDVQQITVNVFHNYNNDLSNDNKNKFHGLDVTRSLYHIDYDLDDGEIKLSNPSYRYQGQPSFTLNNPTKNGYKFLGWTWDQQDTPQTEVTVEGLNVNIKYTANWAKFYSITYELNGGILLLPNPMQYDEKSENITLNNPIKQGHKFIGWTGSNLEKPTEEVMITDDDKGDLYFVANWEIAQLVNDSGECGDNVTWIFEEGGLLFISGLGDMTNFSVGELAPYAKYRAEIINVIIEEGVTSVGDLAFKDFIKLQSVKFQGNSEKTGELNRKILLETNGITRIGKFAFQNCNELKEVQIPDTVSTIDKGAFKDCENLTKLTIGQSIQSIEDEAFQNCKLLEEVNYAGSTSSQFGENVFSGCDKLSKINVLTSYNNNKICGYDVEKVLFTIEYQGLNHADNSLNPTIYNKNEETIIYSPMKAGYKFNGWTGTSIQGETLSLIIPSGSNENKVFTANWEIIYYLISIDYDGGSVSTPNPTHYTVEQIVTLNNPTKDQYKFMGWNGTDIQDKTEKVTIPVGSTGNRNYKANWQFSEVIIDPSTSDEPSDEKKDGISGGAVAGIVIACIIVVAAIAGLVYILLTKNSQEGSDPRTDDKIVPNDAV